MLDQPQAFSGTVKLVRGRISFHHDLDSLARDPAHPDEGTVHRKDDVMYERGPGFEELGWPPRFPGTTALSPNCARRASTAAPPWPDSHASDRSRSPSGAARHRAAPSSRRRAAGVPSDVSADTTTTMTVDEAAHRVGRDEPLPRGGSPSIPGRSEMPGVRRVVLLTLGWEDLPKSVSVHGAPPEERLREPVPGVLLQCDGGGCCSTPDSTPPSSGIRHYGGAFTATRSSAPSCPGPGEPLEEALAGAGILMDEIYEVGLSHLHNDHAGGLRHFAGRIPVHAQRAELDYGMSAHPGPEHHAMFRIDYDDPSIDWRLADGDVEIAPGVTSVLTAGHTPGHQSFIVDLDPSVGGGGLVFAFDAADLTENIEHELPIGGRVDVPPEATIEPIRRLKRLAATRGYPLIPGHDPLVWPALTRELAERFATTG